MDSMKIDGNLKNAYIINNKLGIFVFKRNIHWWALLIQKRQEEVHLQGFTRFVCLIFSNS